MTGERIVFHRVPFNRFDPDQYSDMLMSVRRHGSQAFLSFASNQGYLAGMGHRGAAL